MMSTPNQPHIPVMLDEVMATLAGEERSFSGKVFVDGTFGNGGYTSALLNAGAQVVAIDRDPTAIAGGQELVASSGGRLSLVEGRFGDLADHANSVGFDKVDGVVLDVGVSSMQLDQAERGFSFRFDGPLDMRMEASGPSAADVVNTYEMYQLRHIISALGEDRKAGLIAKAIVRVREEAPIETTSALASLVEKAIGHKPGDKIHPATRTFQALRIYVNCELEELGRALYAAEQVLKPEGHLVVVAFHSLEDRIVKKFLRSRAKLHAGGSRHMPQSSVAPPSFSEVTRKALVAGEKELSRNPRSRSAKLRVGRRLKADAHSFDLSALGVPMFPFSLPKGAA